MLNVASGMALAVFVTGCLSGCMSMANLSGCTAPFCVDGSPPCFERKTEVYGGVKLDARMGAGIITAALQDPEFKPVRDICALAGGAYFLAVDLPLSAVVDTVTLPIAVSRQLSELNHTSDADVPSNPDWVRFWGVDPNGLASACEQLPRKNSTFDFTRPPTSDQPHNPKNGATSGG